MRKLLLVLLLTTTLSAQERVLFIGNSYTAANSLPTLAGELRVRRVALSVLVKSGAAEGLL